MQAKDVMTTPVVTVEPEAVVRDIAKLLLRRRISAVPVVDADHHLLGIVSEGDLMRRPESGTLRHPSWWLRLLAMPEGTATEYSRSHARRARDVMTSRVVSVAEETPLEEIADLLERNSIKRVPVVRDGRLVGIVSRANLLHGLVARGSARAVPSSDREIRAAVTAQLRQAKIDWHVNAVVSSGVLHLWGAVESDAQKHAAHVAAGEVPGVTEVQNHLSVLPPIPQDASGAW